MTQMAGRTGRGKDLGRVFIQTYSPHHYAIQFAAKHDYSGFYREEIERRKSLAYPPFTRLVNVIFRGKQEQKVRDQACELRKMLERVGNAKDVELIGPAPLPLYRLRGHFRWHLMLRAADLNPMQKALRDALEETKRKAGVYLAVDVDPITIL